MEQNVNEILDGRYRIEQYIGSGGTSDVYKAFDLQEKRYVAIKMFIKELMDDEKAKRQFMHENQVFAVLENHPNIISVYEIAVKEDHIYIVMELAEGETLSHYINYHGGRLPLDQAVGFSCQILKALSHIHSKGVVHRDIKTKNIIVLQNSFIKITDFGIASISGIDDETEEVRGTALYMSPEQIKGNKTDTRTDIYSFGIVMYEMLTGVLPFTSNKEKADDRNEEILQKHLREAPVKPSSYAPNLPSALEQIVLKAMSKLPVNRFQSCDEILRYMKLYAEDNNVTFDFELQNDVYDEYAALFPETAPEHYVPVPVHKIGKNADTAGNEAVKSTGKLSRFMAWSVLAAFALFIVVFSVVFAEIVFTGRGQRTVITVGDLVNQTFSESVVEQLEEKGYSVDVEYEYSDTYPQGVIIAQKPSESYAQVLSDGENPHITLVVSGGLRMMLMSDYTGKQFIDVKYELEDAGFKVIVEKQSSDKYTEGQIISTVPEAGKVASQNEAITLYVSVGKDAGYVYVPNVVGLTYAVATDRLTQMGISVLPAVYEYSDEYPAGTVIYQNRAYGEKISSEFSQVELTVSLGSE